MPATVDPRWLGRRVTLRRPVPGGHLADAVGDLLTLTDGLATVDTARGRVQVPVDDVVAGRLVEPATPDVLALEELAARGWRAAEVVTSVDGWLLRADGGVTGRANSALALRTPRRPLPEVVADVRAWYAERGLPLLVTVPLPARSLLDGGLEEYCGLVADVAEDVHVFAARLDRVLALTPPAGPAVEVADAPDEAWLQVHRGGTSLHDPVVRALLARHDQAAFASVRLGGRTVAVGRAVVDTPTGRDGAAGRPWLGLTGLEVVPDARRQGLGRQVVRALAAWGAGRGATHGWLQVASANQPAISLYLRSGWWHHHDYRYRRDPA